MSQIDNLGRVHPCMNQKVMNIVHKRFDMNEMENSVKSLKELVEEEKLAMERINNRLLCIEQSLTQIETSLIALDDMYLKKEDYDALLTEVARKSVTREEYEQIVGDFEDTINNYFNKTPRITVEDDTLKDLKHEIETLRDEIKRMKVKKEMPPINIVKKNKQ